MPCPSLLPKNAKQRALTERFLLSASAYLLGVSLAWIAAAFKLANITADVLYASTGMICTYIIGMFFLYRSGLSNRVNDALLTRLQMLVAIGWSSFFIFHTQALRGAFLMIYLFITMFGFFTLTRPQIMAMSAFISAAYGWVILYDWVQQTAGFNLQINILQWVILNAVLFWLSAFAGYMTLVRDKIRRSSQQIQAQNRQILEANRELALALQKVEELANTDELTGLGNRRQFLAAAKRLMQANYTGNQSVAIALLDIDHFKNVNDSFGHQRGDLVLKEIARLMLTVIPVNAILTRFGGEEFVLLLPDADMECTRTVCEQIRSEVAGYSPASLTRQHTITLSVGATLFCPADSLDGALKRADQALYKAKTSGRNQCAYDFSLHSSITLIPELTS